MTVIMRWKAKSWEKTSLMCRVFGHIWTGGWWGWLPYLRPRTLPGELDGIGRRHVRLTCRCDRCDLRSEVAYVHNWETSPR